MSINVSTDFNIQDLRKKVNFYNVVYGTRSLRGMSIVEHIKGAGILSNNSMNVTFLTDACATNDSTVVLSDKKVTNDFSGVYAKVCVSELEKIYTSEVLAKGVEQSYTEFIADNIEDSLRYEVTKEMIRKIFLGLYNEADSDGDVIAAPAFNIASVVTDIIGAASEDMVMENFSRDENKLSIYVSPSQLAPILKSINETSLEYENGSYSYLGYNIVPAYGIPVGKAIMTFPENIAVLTDSVDDASAIAISQNEEKNELVIRANTYSGGSYFSPDKIVLAK